MSYIRLCFGIVVHKEMIPKNEYLPNVHRWWHAMCGCGDRPMTPGELMKCMSDSGLEIPVNLYEISGEKDLWIVSPVNASVRTEGNIGGVNLEKLYRFVGYVELSPFYEFLKEIQFDFLKMLPEWFLVRTEN